MSDDPDEQRLQEAYYSPKTMGSLSKMLRMFKGSIPDSFIREWVKKQEYNQLYTPKKRVFMPVLPKDGQAQMDLMFYPWRGKLWPILWVVEVANRKAYARELRSKEAKNVTPELKSILEEANGITSIVADAGSEFINKSMKAMLEAEGVEPKGSGAIRSAAVHQGAAVPAAAGQLPRGRQGARRLEAQDV